MKDEKGVFADLARVRKERGIGQANLAELLGISRNYLSQIETGKQSNVSWELKAKIDQFLFVNNLPILFRIDAHSHPEVELLDSQYYLHFGRESWHEGVLERCKYLKWRHGDEIVIFVDEVKFNQEGRGVISAGYTVFNGVIDKTY